MMFPALSVWSSGRINPPIAYAGIVAMAHSSAIAKTRCRYSSDVWKSDFWKEGCGVAAGAVCSDVGTRGGEHNRPDQITSDCECTRHKDAPNSTRTNPRWNNQCSRKRGGKINQTSTKPAF